MDLHPIQPVKFDRQCNLNEFTPNSTDRIQPAIQLASKAFNRQCNLNGFTPNLIGRIRLAIRLVKFDQALITGQIG